jgi:hypothetical protein
MDKDDHSTSAWRDNEVALLNDVVAWNVDPEEPFGVAFRDHCL